MNLIYLPCNQVWAFQFIESLTRVGCNSLFFETRAEAEAAAEGCGLKVDTDGKVSPAT